MRFGSASALTVFLATITLASCERTRAAPFPPVDRERLQITLTRTGCFGTCPDYKVTVDGRGHVVFRTRGEPASDPPSSHHRYSDLSYVVAPGQHEDQIDRQAVEQLVGQFRQAGFFSLKDQYSAQITDNPTYVLEIDTGHGRKRVVDYVGRDAGMPQSVTELEDAVDRATGAARWVTGANGLVQSLQEEKFDFHSVRAAEILLAATEEGGDDTLLSLVRLGAPLDAVAGKTRFGSVILLAAIEHGRTPLFQALVERGWLDRVGRNEAGSSFAFSSGGCSPTLIKAAVASGIPIDATTNREADKRMESDGAETALASLAHSYQCGNDEALLETARTLLANGADPNKRDGKGETPLFGVENKELLELLLAHGADPKIVDKDGSSAIFGSWTDDIVLRLLQAGSSPKGQYFDGKTLLEEMKERPMPKTKAWLDAHPDKMALANLK